MNGGRLVSRVSTLSRRRRIGNSASAIASTTSCERPAAAGSDHGRRPRRCAAGSGQQHPLNQACGALGEVLPAGPGFRTRAARSTAASRVKVRAGAPLRGRMRRCVDGPGSSQGRGRHNAMRSASGRARSRPGRLPALRRERAVGCMPAGIAPRRPATAITAHGGLRTAPGASPATKPAPQEKSQAAV